MQHGSLAFFHCDGHPERLGHDEDVAEDDTGVEPGIAVDRLEREGAGDGRGLAALEERVLCSDRQEF